MISTVLAVRELPGLVLSVTDVQVCTVPSSQAVSADTRLGPMDSSLHMNYAVVNTTIRLIRVLVVD